MLKRLSIGLALLLAVPAAAAPSDCAPFVGARIVASDGKFLGTLSSKYDSDSVFNKYGTYGSKYSSDSIWNKYGEYGSKYSNNSAFNPYSSEPPMIISGRQVVGSLSKNKYLRGAIDPILLSVVCFDYEPE